MGKEGHSPLAQAQQLMMHAAPRRTAHSTHFATSALFALGSSTRPRTPDATRGVGTELALLTHANAHIFTRRRDAHPRA